MTIQKPLPPYMTLEKAAKEISARLGQEWDEADLLGCADGGELSIGVVVPTAVHFVPTTPKKGEYEEFTLPAGAMAFNFGDALIRRILLHGTGYLTERNAPIKSTPFEKWATDEEWVPHVAWEIADGETPPEIRLEDCRVTADSLEGLIASYTPKSVDDKPPPATPESFEKANAAPAVVAGQCEAGNPATRLIEEVIENLTRDNRKVTPSIIWVELGKLVGNSIIVDSQQGKFLCDIGEDENHPITSGSVRGVLTRWRARQKHT